MTRTIIVGSRRSALALTQTKWVINRLQSLRLPYTFEIKEMVTKGDQVVDRMLSKVGGKGLFVKEIEQALLNQEIDFAVHSMKDLPAELPDGLVVGAIPEREDPRDCLISVNRLTLDQLPSGAVIGTSSLRRSAQLLHYRSDLEIKWIRGNIDTRLRKLREEDYDAIILAASGLKRMGWSEDTVSMYLAPELILPAVGQGALGIECRQSDAEVLKLLQHIHCSRTGRAVAAERSFLTHIEGSCQVPVAAYATLEDEQIRLSGLVGTPDGKQLLKAEQTGEDPFELGRSVAEQLLKQGADQILERVRMDLQ